MKPRLRYSGLHGLWYIARFPNARRDSLPHLCELVRQINRLNTQETAMDSNQIESRVQQLQAELDCLKKLLSPEPKFRVREVTYKGKVRSYTVRRAVYNQFVRSAVVATVDVVKEDTEGAKKLAGMLAEYYNSLE